VWLFGAGENFMKWNPFLTFLLDGSGCMKVTHPNYFLLISDYSYDESYIYHGYILYKVEIIFP
jgi:hypothetical protein